MDKASRILVPLEPWIGNGLDLRVKGKSADLGAFAESLVYYDQVLLNMTSRDQMSALLGWLAASDCIPLFMELLENSVVIPYYYDFFVTPIYIPENDAYSLRYNIQEKADSRFGLFRDTVIGRIDYFIVKRKEQQRFIHLLENTTHLVSPDTYGKSGENAQELILDAVSCKNLIGSLLESLHENGLIESVPELSATAVVNSSGQRKISLNVDLAEIGKTIGKHYNVGRHTPFAIAVTANRLMWSAASEMADLSTSNPMYSFLCSNLENAVIHFGRTKYNLSRLIKEVDFPDIRHEVNMGHLSANQIIDMRKYSKEFRGWLHKETELDHDILVHYYNDLIKRFNIPPFVKKVLDITSVCTSAVISSVIGGQIDNQTGAVVGTAAGSFLKDIVAKLDDGWSPKIFGNKIRRIADK
jgi:hypothetical protein